MIWQIDFQDSTTDRWRGRYERLNEKEIVRAKRLMWTKKVNGRSVKGVKISRPRKLNWKPFSIMFMLPRKIGKMYAGFVKRMKMEEACPSITFSCSQWGFPILSHSYLTRR